MQRFRHCASDWSCSISGFSTVNRQRFIGVLNNELESVSERHWFAANTVEVHLMRHVRRGFQQTIELSFHHLIFVFRHLIHQPSSPHWPVGRGNHRITSLQLCSTLQTFHLLLWAMGCWCGYLSGVWCKWFAYSPADALTLLVGQPEGHPAGKKTEWWGAVFCLGWDADLHIDQLMPLPLTVSCFRKI